MKYTIAFILFISTSCNNQNSKNKEIIHDTRVTSLESKLIGEWGGLGEDKPIWRISNDSIYYFQENESYPYQILDNNLIIERNDAKAVLRNISVELDTLKFEDPPGIVIKGYRFK